MKDTLKFTVPGKPEYIGPVRIAISMVAADMGFDVDAIEDIKMAVSEACSKAICPGAAGLGLYEVTCDVTADGLVISVIDRDGGCRFEHVEDPCVECTKQDGLGLSVLRALMDEVAVYEEPGVGEGVRMTKRVK